MLISVFCCVLKFSLVCFFEIIAFYHQFVFWAYNGIYLIFNWSVLRFWYWCFDFLFHFYLILLLTEIMSLLYPILQLSLFNYGRSFVSCIVIRSFASAHFSTSSPSLFVSFKSHMLLWLLKSSITIFILWFSKFVGFIKLNGILGGVYWCWKDF